MYIHVHHNITLCTLFQIGTFSSARQHCHKLKLVSRLSHHTLHVPAERKSLSERASQEWEVLCQWQRVPELYGDSHETVAVES